MGVGGGGGEGGFLIFIYERLQLATEGGGREDERTCEHAPFGLVCYCFAPTHNVAECWHSTPKVPGLAS